MKNLLEHMSHTTELFSNRRSTAHNINILAEIDAVSYHVAKYEIAESVPLTVDSDEMQIDKLYQSL